MAKKSFQQKLEDSKNMPQIVEVLDPKSIQRYGGTKMLIAPPLFYDRIMKEIPAGKLITTEMIRNILAKEEKADFTCPLTAGIFINIVANASFEREGNKTPYWRTIKTNGELNPKYPGGIEEQTRLLELEGHQVIQKGKKFYVKDYENALVSYL